MQQDRGRWSNTMHNSTLIKDVGRSTSYGWYYCCMPSFSVIPFLANMHLPHQNIQFGGHCKVTSNSSVHTNTRETIQSNFIPHLMTFTIERADSVHTSIIAATHVTFTLVNVYIWEEITKD